MLRIVGLQRNESSQREFILLQNQGNLRVQLRGHVVMTEGAIDGGSSASYVFADEALVPAGMYVMLVTGIGEPRWVQTKESALVYYTFINRETPMWDDAGGPIHILAVQHSFAERPIEQLLKV